MNKGILLVLSGLSGAGKDTIVDLLLQKKEYNFQRIITHNTRPKRENEIHGRDYYFVSDEEFERLVSINEIIEKPPKGKYGSHKKGTSKTEIERVFEGENLIWRVDPGRLALADDFFLKTFSPQKGNEIVERMIRVFISVSDVDILRQRYMSREKNADISEFEKRLDPDLEILEKYRHRIPHIINNDSKVEIAVNEIVALVDQKLHNGKERK